MKALILLVLLAAAPWSAPAADFTGTWKAQFDTQIGVQKYTFALQQEGSRVTGKAHSEIGGEKHESPLKGGKAEGDTVSFVEELTRNVGQFGSQQALATRLAAAPPRPAAANAIQPGRGRGFGGPIELNPDDKAAFPNPPEGYDQPLDGIARGKLERVEYESKTVGAKRWMQVYTPPGYTKDQTYPVLYLLHGIGGNEREEWARGGVPHVILDRLIAAKKIEPMILVLPNGNATTNTTGGGGPGGGGGRAAGFGGWGKPFENDLLHDIIPYIEAHYSVKADRENRALAGLSMGGGQSLNIGLGHLETFAWVGGFSSAPNTLPPEQLVPNPDQASKELKLLYLSCGNKDGLIRISQGLHAYLKERNVPHVWHVDEHAHDFEHWKKGFYNFALLTFQPRQGTTVLSTLEAAVPARPIHVLYLGPVDAIGSGSRGSGGSNSGSRTNYVYLPGQTLAPQAIYFDHLSDPTHLTATYLNHFDAVVQVLPEKDLEPSHRKALDDLKAAGKGRIQYSERPEDAVLREAVLDAISPKTRSDWEAFVASRPPLQRLPGEVPNYERRPEPIQYQAPLSPTDSMAYTQVPADFELQLFAAEPDVVKPVYLAWDERGRAWVVEARDYPHGLVDEGQPGLARIKICEDTDGDGQADKFTVFADQLNLATALVFANGGIIVSQARHMLFLKDTDGDDQADVRQTLLPGWGVGDSHATQSNLQRGFDNWLYGCVGYSNFRGTVGGQELQFGQGVFRFTADGSALQFLHQYNNNTWGVGINETGEVFGSTANGNPSFYGYLPAYLLNPTQPGSGRRGPGGFRPGYRLDSQGADEVAPANVRRLPSAKSLAPGMRMHPNTPNVRMVDNFGGYTAAAGHAFMISDALPTRLQGKALVTEPTAKLIGIMDIERDGAGYKASDGFNLLASTDEWMSPIFADIGPDGAIWVIDFYNFIIQHNPTPTLQSAGINATTGLGGAYKTENDLRDQTHGRIYRVVWKDAPPSPIQSLAQANTSEIVAALDSGNQFWSLTAQRLIVDNTLKDAAPALRRRVTSGAGGKGAIHALWALDGLGALDKDTHQKALLDKDSALRRNAVRAIPATEAGRQLFFSSAVIQDPDLLTRQTALVKLAELPTIPEIQTVVAQLPRVTANLDDPFLNDTLTMLGRIHKVAEVGDNEVKVTAGDVKRGEDLFHHSPVASCASCHRVDGKGGDVGPILDGIAVRSDPAQILESLMEPNAKLAQGYEDLTISPMPPLGILLKEQELADILSYLQTLTTPPKDGITVPVRAVNEFE